MPRDGILADGQDQDGFQVALQAGHAYSVSLDFDQRGDMEVDVTDPAGAYVAGIVGPGGTFTAPVGGVYTLDVGTDDSHQSGDAYTLTVAAAAAARASHP